MPELEDIVGKAQKERALSLLKITTINLKRAKIENPKIKARLFLALLDGVALHYLTVYEKYPLSTMKPKIVSTVKNLCEDFN